MCDSDGNAAPIHWQSKKIRRIVKSTLAAECLSMEDAVDAAYYIKNILMEVLLMDANKVQMECFIDSKSLHAALHSSTNGKEDKRLILDLSLLKEMYEKNEIHRIERVDTKEQVADALTKRGASAELLRKVINTGSINCIK